MLLEKEVQKQDYSRALKEQMEINSSKRQAESLKRKEQDLKLEHDIQQYYEKLKQEQPRPLNAFSKYEEQPASPLKPRGPGNSGELEPVAPAHDMLDAYEQQMKERERQRQDWRLELEAQRQEQERAKAEQREAQKRAELADEERFQRQIEELRRSEERDNPKNSSQR